MLNESSEVGDRAAAFFLDGVDWHDGVSCQAISAPKVHSVVNERYFQCW